MSRIRGSIKSGDEILLEDISLWLEETVDHRSGLKGWYGSFSLASGQVLQLGAQYLLILEDGRSGQILLKRQQIGSGGSKVEFQGTGPLA